MPTSSSCLTPASSVPYPSTSWKYWVSRKKKPKAEKPFLLNINGGYIVVYYMEDGLNYAKVKVIVRGPLNGGIFLVMKEVIVIMGPLRGQVISGEVSRGNMWAKFINYGTVKVRAQGNVHR